MSTFAGLFASGGVKSIQEGFTSGATSTSTGEDIRYVDITISAVVVAKCVVEFIGGAGTSAAAALTPASNYICTARLTGTTTLRIATTNTVTTIAGRWRVVEAF